MFKYTHIESFVQVAKYVKATNTGEGIPDKYKVQTPVRFRGTVKLHGTNVGVECDANGILVPQSRSRVLSIADDFYGFAKFVDQNADVIREIVQTIRVAHKLDADKFMLYGEWVGPGVQSGMALNQLPRKQWVLFGVAAVEGDTKRYLDVLPALGRKYEAADIHSIMDAPTWEVEVDFADKGTMQAALEYGEKLALEVEAECPWGKLFGIEGMGEGIVWVPVGDHWGNSDLYWKSKGPKHKNVKAEKVTLAPEVVASIEAFVEFAVTENRLQQGLDHLREMGHEFDMRNASHYLKWLGQDVKRECAAELEANDLDWKLVGKVVSRKAMAFYKGVANSL